MDDLDNIVLTLTNERKFYDCIINNVKQYRDDDIIWSTFEARVRTTAKLVGVDLYDDISLSEQVAEAIHEHYKEEVYGRPEEVPMKDDKPKFKVGDKIRRVGGRDWSSRYGVVTVSKVIDKNKVYAKETNTWLYAKDLELANPSATLAERQQEIEIKPTKQEETIMSKLIETKTFIRGVEASKVDDDTIFSYIAEVEGEMASLRKIDNQPLTLKKKIEDMGKEVAELVAFVDSRNDLK